MVTMRADSLVTMENVFCQTLFERHEEAQGNLRVLSARLSRAAAATEHSTKSRLTVSGECHGKSTL